MCREERMWSSMARNTMQQHCTIHSVSYLLLLGDERRTETWRLQRCQYAIKSRFRQYALSLQWKQTHSRNYNCTCLSSSFSSNLAMPQYSYTVGMIMSSSLLHCWIPLLPHHNEEVTTFSYSYNHKPISFHRDNSALKNEVIVHAFIPYFGDHESQPLCINQWWGRTAPFTSHPLFMPSFFYLNKHTSFVSKHLQPVITTHFLRNNAIIAFRWI